MPVLLVKHYPPDINSVDDEIHRRLKLGETHSFLSIVPTKRKVRDLQREYLKTIPGGVTGACYLYTLETLAVELHALFCRPKRLVSGPVQALLVQEAIRFLEGTLLYFRSRNGTRNLPRGTFQKIFSVVNVLKEQGIYPAILHEEVQAGESGEREKLNDILAIYEAYERLLGDKYIDAAGLTKEANYCCNPETAPPLFRQRFEGCGTLFVAGFDRFSDPELTLIHHLSSIQGIGTV